MAGEIQINLESLIDLSGRLNETHDELFILNSSLLSIMGKLKIIKGAAYSPDITSNDFVPVIIKGKSEPIAIPYKNYLSDFFVNDGEIPGFDYKNLFPINFQGKTLGLICLGEKATGDEITAQELQYAGIVVSITSNAIQNARNHNSLIKSKANLEKRNQLLTTLFEMSKDFSSLLSRNEILKVLSFRLMGQLMVSRFGVVIFNNNSTSENLINRFEKDIPAEIILLFSKITATQRINPLDQPEQFSEYLSKAGIKVVSPMIIQGNLKGILFIGKKMNNEEFSEENINFIEALANLSISALETERLFLEELEKERLEGELQLALEIQMNLLPKNLPDCQGFEFSGISIPAKQVGGDYYDFIPLDGNRILIAIADVSGKGMPAALLMANVQAALRTLAPLDLPLHELVLRINNVVYQNTSADKFVTFFVGILNCCNQTFRYINAGHNPPILFKNDGTLFPLTEGGLILGISDADLKYFDNEIKLDCGELLLFFTDGVTEAMDSNDNEYTEDRLILHIKENHQNSCRKESEKLILKEMLLNIVTDIQHHSSGINQSDDITLSAIRCL